MAVWYTVVCVVIWYIFPLFGILCREKNLATLLPTLRIAMRIEGIEIAFLAKVIKDLFQSLASKKNRGRPSIDLKRGLPDGKFSNQKIIIWVNFGGTCNGSCCYILWPFRIFYARLVYFMVIWYIVPRKIWQPCSTIDVS
jgi:hypothetical protein